MMQRRLPPTTSQLFAVLDRATPDARRCVQVWLYLQTGELLGGQQRKRSVASSRLLS